MGKDVRGIERGKCACGEGEDFMRSDGATCGYCGCLPTRHSCLDKNAQGDQKKQETEREQVERLKREYNDIDWVGLYNSNKLSSLKVDELSLYFSHHKITFKGKKAEKVAMIKDHIGSLLYNSMACQQPRQPPLRNVQRQVTSSLSEVETDSQSDVVDQVAGSSPRSLSNALSPETDFIPEPLAETLSPSKYGRKWALVKRDNYVSWDKTVF